MLDGDFTRRDINDSTKSAPLTLAFGDALPWRIVGLSVPPLLMKVEVFKTEEFNLNYLGNVVHDKGLLLPFSYEIHNTRQTDMQ